MTGQWLHTEPDPRTDRWPLAPWAQHPDVDLDRELLAELLSTLREDVIRWHEIAAEQSSDYAEHRVEGAINALKLAERLVKRANYRAQLRAERGQS